MHRMLEIPGYRLHKRLGKGGMAEVYLATQLSLDREVAVKVLLRTEDAAFTERFIQEGHIVASLRHPAIITIHDIGQIADGRHYLAMEYLGGGDLAQHRGIVFSPARALDIIRQLAGGLAVVHDGGLVHRDVKPENVLISERGEVKVADFGLVRAIAEAGVTSASVILGTAAYLSPEQVESGDADARSDVYSTGVMMFELLTGRTPFRGDTPLALAYQRLSYDVPAPGDVVDGVPEEFDEIVLRATERNPAERYADGFDMQRALLAAAEDLDLPPFTVPAPRRSAERETMARMRAGAPAGAPPATPGPPQHTRVQSQATPGVPPSRGRAAQPTRAARAVPAEQDDNGALRAAIWIGLVLVLAIAIGAAAWWAGQQFLI